MGFEGVSLRQVRVKTVSGASSLTISAESGESHKLLEVYADSPADKSYMDIKIGGVTVCRVPVKWGDLLLVAPPESSVMNISIIQLLQDLFEGLAFEADQDEDITLEFSSAPSAIHAIYAVGAPGIDKTALGRSKCDNRIILPIVTHANAITATGNVNLDKSIVPTGYPEIKDGYTIPSGRELILRALCFGAAVSGSSKPTKLHVWDENYELFDPENHSGINVDPSANILKADINTGDIFRVEPYAITPGHKLTINIDATHDGANDIAAETEAFVPICLWRVI